MPLTTEDEVRAIIEVDSAITDLSPFINAASAIVTSKCADLDETTATIVETWLAAHFTAIRDMRSSSEGVSGVTQGYQYKLGLGLMVTMYGQTALTLDTSGGLAKWNSDLLSGKSGKSPGILWLGTEAE